MHENRRTGYVCPSFCPVGNTNMFLFLKRIEQPSIFIWESFCAAGLEAGHNDNSSKRRGTGVEPGIVPTGDYGK